MIKNNDFIAPSGDMYLTTDLEQGTLPPFLTKAVSIMEKRLSVSD